MKSVEFVNAIKKRVIDSDAAFYRQLLEDTTFSRDPIWKEVLPIFKSLNSEQQVSFLNFPTLIQVNAVSHIFGILDGSTYLDENRESFVLTSEQGKELINGNLQDIFLNMIDGS